MQETIAQDTFEQSPKFRLSTAYTLYLILGIFSAHRFYLKRPISAIFQMLGGFGFFIWFCFLGAVFLLTNENMQEVLISLKPDLNFNSANIKENTAKLSKIIKVFALPNLAYLVWIIYDFFNLEKMVKEANFNAGYKTLSVEEHLSSEEKSANLSSAKQLIYISCAISIFMKVLSIFGIEIQALQIASLAVPICAVIALLFIAQITLSRTLLRNLILLSLFDSLLVWPVIMIMLGENSALYTALIAIFCLIGLIFAMLIYKELFDCSGRKIYTNAFFVYAILIIIKFCIFYFNANLGILVAEIITIINSLFIIACAKDSQNFEISQNNYYLKNLKFHLSGFNKISF